MNTKYTYPNEKGKYGVYGGKYVPETLMTALYELENTYKELRLDENFLSELREIQRDYNGRPTPLTFAKRLTEHFGKGKIYLKREDLCHTGAHKMNNASDKFYLPKNLARKEL